MRRVKLTVAYDGAAYCGFQLQANGVTIQSVLEDALSRLLQEPGRIRAASRTDAGVHAREQVVDFADPGGRSLDTILRGGNALLPPDIRILSAEEVPASFNARRDAKSKEYRYFLYLGPVVSPFLSRYSWHLGKPVDIGAMRRGLAHTLGKHDFSSFRGQGCPAKTPASRRNPFRVWSPSALRVVVSYGTWCATSRGPSSTSARGGTRRTGCANSSGFGTGRLPGPPPRPTDCSSGKWCTGKARPFARPAESGKTAFPLDVGGWLRFNISFDFEEKGLPG
jgi:tRNA pseudouridine38-40 synthase